MQRISVIGTSGSGKTTLARELSRRLNIPHIELDAIHWQPNWTPTPGDVMRLRVAAAAAGNSWTMCGNYGAVRDLILARADTIIWLDYSLTVVFTRTLRRTFLRCWNRETLWSGNRESLFLQFCTEHSIFLWVLTTWRKRRRDYPKMLRFLRSQGKCILHFRTPRQLERWLNP